MIIYIAYEVKFHHIAIEDEEQKKKFEAALHEALMKLYNFEYGSDVEITMIEFAGKL